MLNPDIQYLKFILTFSFHMHSIPHTPGSTIYTLINSTGKLEVIKLYKVNTFVKNC